MGPTVGLIGLPVGTLDGFSVGVLVGLIGLPVGTLDGFSVGLLVGLIGLPVGAIEGVAVGLFDGALEGLGVGLELAVGERVGSVDKHTRVLGLPTEQDSLQQSMSS